MTSRHVHRVCAAFSTYVQCQTALFELVVAQGDIASNKPPP